MDDKIKILIASVLKPADDVRSCFKIGQSLAQTNKYEVNIIGFNSKKKAKHQNIFLFPTFKFRRNSLKRLFAPFSILKLYLKLKPKVIIVNTPELLWVIFLIKIIFGTKTIYDIRENYRFNVQQNQIYNGIMKSILSASIFITESLSRHFIDGYFLAEDIYERQLSFIHQKPYIKLFNKSVLETKHKIEPVKFANRSPLKFIYSGTIGTEYGTLEAIEFIKNLHELDPEITLTIIGYSSDNEYLNTLKKVIYNLDYVELKTGLEPIPQSEIISEIENSDIALLPYQLNPNISGRFPTKIYDYLALGIPMIIPPNQQWEAYLAQYKAGLSVDFNEPDIKGFIKALYSTSFYVSHPRKEILWSSQVSSLLEFTNKILSK